MYMQYIEQDKFSHEIYVSKNNGVVENSGFRSWKAILCHISNLYIRVRAKISILSSSKIRDSKGCYNLRGRIKALRLRHVSDWPGALDSRIASTQCVPRCHNARICGLQRNGRICALRHRRSNQPNPRIRGLRRRRVIHCVGAIGALLCDPNSFILTQSE